MNHRYFSELEYNEFGRHINAKLLRERIPLSGAIELTNRCNLKCVHCYCNQASGDEGIKKQELSTSQIIKILADAEKRSCLWLLFTGGEPLLREDFFDIYIHAKKRGFLVTVFTNGTLITSDAADIFAEWPPSTIEVTLYGATKETYEKITGIPGSFKLCMDGIRTLRERGVPVDLKTMVSTLNMGEIRDIKKLAKTISPRFRLDPLIQSRIDGQKEPCRYRVSPEEAVSLDLEDHDRLEGWKKYLKKAGELEMPDSLFSCGAGKDSFFIDPYGYMCVCSMCTSLSYKIGEYSFDDIWDERFPETLGKKQSSDFKCRGCDAAAYCDHCAGWGMTENRDPGSVVEYLCEIARLRKAAFKEKIKS